MKTRGEQQKTAKYGILLLHEAELGVVLPPSSSLLPSWHRLSVDPAHLCRASRFYAALLPRGHGFVAYCRTDRGESVSVSRDERQRHLPAGRKAQLAAHVADTGQVT